MKKKFFLRSGCFVVAALLLATTVAVAADKSWSGEGDGTDWFDEANWLPAEKPAASDNTKIDVRSARVEVDSPFESKSLTLGGKKDSVVSVSNFVNAELAPDNPTDNAALVRKDGKLVLKGSAGKLTLKGAYKDSEEVIPDEPSFMLYVK